MTSPILETHHLAKEYRPTQVLRDVSLSVMPGECVALIGRNGSGKSTLLRLLTGLTRPTSGTVSPRPGLSIGYVPERIPTPRLNVREFLFHMGRMEGLPKETLAGRIPSLLECFHLGEMAAVPLRHLSKGSLQKVGVIQALLTDHDLLVLDEPLSGQDVLSQQSFIETVLARKTAGCAVLLSCHEPFLVNRLADRVFALEEGTLREVSGEDARLLEYDFLSFTGPRPWPDFLASYTVREAEGRLILTVPVAKSNDMVVQMIQAGYTLKEFHHADGM